jgi:hypothetical protein
MAQERLKNAMPKIALAAINPNTLVKSAATGTQERAVLAVATNNEDVLGVAAATAGASGSEAITVYGEGAVVKVKAAASIGIGAECHIASSNGALGPVVGASGTARYSAGLSESAAAAGEYFSLLVRPRKLSGSP